jgi:hypothetical protein
MADAVVASVEADGVKAVQPLHPFRERRSPRLDEEMEVVVEERPGPDPPAEAPAHLRAQLRPLLPIEVVQEDLPPLHAAADHVVVGRAREL